MDKKLLIKKIKKLSRIFYERPADEYDEYILQINCLHTELKKGKINYRDYKQ